LYELLAGRRAADWRMLSSSLTESSLEFLHQRPEVVKRAIKLLKFWNKQAEKKEYRLRSYAWEIIACALYASNPAPNTLSAPQLYVSVLQMISGLSAKHYSIILFREFIDPTQIVKYDTSLRHQLIVVDPLNPHIDVTDDFAHWIYLSAYATRTLENLAK